MAPVVHLSVRPSIGLSFSPSFRYQNNLKLSIIYCHDQVTLKIWISVGALKLSDLDFWNNWLFFIYCTSFFLCLCQMTYFRLFQTERVCRWQLQIWWKWQEVSWIGRKHCGKGEIAHYDLCRCSKVIWPWFLKQPTFLQLLHILLFMPLPNNKF